MANRNSQSPPPLVAMVEAEGRGRALVASTPLRAGQIILKDSPILLYSALPLLPLPRPSSAPGAQTNSDPDYCSHCFKFISKQLHPPPPSLCHGCSSSFFCSSNCQSVARSSSHTPWVCQALQKLRNPGSSPILHCPVELQVQARFLIAAYNLAAISPSNFQTLLSLQGEPLPELKEASLFLHSLVSVLGPPQTVLGMGSSVELTAALLAKDKLNAFGVMEPFDRNKERSVRAYGIYPRASFFNHDCLPNACRFDYVDAAVSDGCNTDIIVRVIHDVPQGREICLSYFPVNRRYSERQRRLKEYYGFVCDCDRCKVEANWSDQEDEELDEGNEGEEESAMDEADGDEMEAQDEDGVTQDGSDFPHAYFFFNYLCNMENCWGTLAPLPPSDSSPSTELECNVCGNISSSKEFMDGNVVD